MNFCACSFMSNIYILGGDTNNCISFDPKTNVFDCEVATMKEVRKQAGCAVFGGRIVVSGGIDEIRQDGLHFLKTVEVYDRCANEWSNMPDMLHRRYGHASVSIRNKLYIIGGCEKQCEVFDSFCQKFADIKPILPIYTYYAFKTHYLIMGNKIKIYNKKSLDAAVFDVEKEEWLEVEDFRMIRSYGRRRIPKY